MTLIQLIVAMGVGAGLLAVLVAILFDRLRKRTDGNQATPDVPKTLTGGLGIGGIPGPLDLLACQGQHENPRMSLSTTIMTPTNGLRVISLFGSALVLILLWSPWIGMPVLGLSMNLLVTGLIAYAVLFIAGYEVRYDAEGMTLPNWLFVNKTHKWEDFINIRDNGHYLYRIQFATGRVQMQKYLVGMPAFLTFVSDVKELNQKRR